MSLTTHDLRRALEIAQDGGYRAVRAITPHGSYTFAVTDVGHDEDGTAVLHLKEVARKAKTPAPTEDDGIKLFASNTETRAVEVEGKDYWLVESSIRYLVPCDTTPTSGAASLKVLALEVGN